MLLQILFCLYINITLLYTVFDLQPFGNFLIIICPFLYVYICYGFQLSCFCLQQQSSVGYQQIDMFLKIKFNGQIYLIAQSRVQNLQKLIEIVEKNFTKLPQVYQFTCIDAKGNKKSLRSQQTLGQFRQKMKNLQEILIVPLQISNQLSLIIQTVREKIQHQSARANEKSNDLKRPDKYEKKKSDSKQQNKQISLRKVASGDQPQNKYENQLLLNMFKRQVIGRRRKPQQSIEVNIPSNNGSLDELAAQNLAIILQIPISQAIVHIRKYPSRNIEQIINIIMEGTN